ncbi:MAG: MFS transporter [Anaerolineales bacterium]|nr:MFS transporter [Anaerolineales bacterium]
MENSNSHWARRFYTLWSGQALSLLGSQLVQFAIIWYLTEKTQSATTLAIASMMGLLPQVLLSPFIGTWVDRGNRRLIMIVSDSIVALATAALAILFMAGIVQVWHIYIVLLIRAVAGGFHQSAFGASVVLLVPKDELARVQGFNQALNGGMNIISAPLGAYLLAILPMQGILAVDFATALIAVTIVFLTQIPQPEKSASAASASFWQDFKAGYRYIIAWRGLVILLLLAMVINFFFSATEPLTPLLITKHFNGNASQLALWLSLFSVGMLLGGLILGVWGGFKKKMITVLAGLILMGICTSGIGVIPSNLFTVGLIVNVAFGVLLPIVNGSLGAILQSSVTPEMQGRVFAFMQSIAMLVSPLALIIAGPFADRFGIQPWFILTGVICLLLGIVGFFFPEVMSMEAKAQENEISAVIQPS